MASDKLPTELNLEIFLGLNSLKDVISLASTSRRLRGIWVEHADVIYRAVAPQSIEGEKHARLLQLSISGNIKITWNDASSIFYRSKFMKSMIQEFTHKIVERLPRIGGWREIYKDGRPKHMTRTERRRFIRTYYQLWALIILPEEQWPSAIAWHTIKQVYLLREMCFIPLAIGPDPLSPKVEQYWYRRDGTPSRWPNFEGWKQDGRRGELGYQLQYRLAEHLERMSTLDTGDKYWVDDYPWLFRQESMNEGFAGFHLLWDHNTVHVKQYCLARRKEGVYRQPTEEEAEYERQHQWVESSEEEEEEG